MRYLVVILTAWSLCTFGVTPSNLCKNLSTLRVAVPTLTHTLDVIERSEDSFPYADTRRYLEELPVLAVNKILDFVPLHDLHLLYWSSSGLKSKLIFNRVMQRLVAYERRNHVKIGCIISNVRPGPEYYRSTFEYRDSVRLFTDTPPGPLESVWSPSNAIGHKSSKSDIQPVPTRGLRGRLWLNRGYYVTRVRLRLSEDFVVVPTSRFHLAVFAPFGSTHTYGEITAAGLLQLKLIQGNAPNRWFKVQFEGFQIPASVPADKTSVVWLSEGHSVQGLIIDFVEARLTCSPDHPLLLDDGAVLDDGDGDWLVSYKIASGLTTPLPE